MTDNTTKLEAKNGTTYIWPKWMCLLSMFGGMVIFGNIIYDTSFIAKTLGYEIIGNKLGSQDEVIDSKRNI